MMAMRDMVVCAALALAVQSGCAADEPSTGVSEAPVLDMAGNFYSLREFGPAMATVATNQSFTPFVTNPLSSVASIAKVTTGYEELTGIIGETTSGSVRIHVAKYAGRLFTKPSDGITNVSVAALKSLLVGVGDGDATTTTTPSSCATTLGGVTVAAYIPDNIGAASELLRNKFAVTDQGVWTWCANTTFIWRDGSGLHGQKWNGSSLVSVTLTPTCSASDAADVCLGKQATVAGHVAIASINASNASNARAQVASTTDSDSNIRSGAYPLVLNLTLVQDTAQHQLDGFMTRITGAGKTAFESDLVAQGATSCDASTPLNCP